MSPVAVAYSGLSAPIVRAEVALATAEELAPVVGSFTEAGMAFAIQPDGTAMLVAVGPDAAPGAASAFEGDGPGASAPGEQGDAAEGAAAAGEGAIVLSIPSSVEHDGVAYEVSAIGAHALSLCGADEVAIPASVSAIDEDALWPTSAQRVEVDAANPSYASYDGILYDASLTRLLSIPGGRQGAVRISNQAEGVEASAFSHSAGVDAVSVDAGGAALASWDGLLYTADGTTLLRVPAGATSITIHDGCTAIAPGALEGCSALEGIEALSGLMNDDSAEVPAPPILSADVVLAGESAPVPLVAAPNEAAVAAAEDNSESRDRLTVVGASGTLYREITISSTGNVSTAESRVIATYAVPYTPAFNFIGAGARVQSGQLVTQFYRELNGVSYYYYYGPSSGCSGVTQAVMKRLSVGDGQALESYTLGSSWNTKGNTHYDSSRWVIFVNGAQNRTLSWNANGGTVSTGSGSYACGAALTLQTPQRPGYNCTGWYTASSGGTKLGNAGATVYVPSVPVVSGAALAEASQYYAQWSAKTITCTWNSNGGTAVGGTSATYSSAAKVPMPTTEPKRDHYRFLGWFTAPSGGSPVTSATALPTDNVTYYAQWASTLVTVTWDANGGSAVAPTVQDQGDPLQMPANPTRDGYTFAGWFTERDGGSQVLTTSVVPQANATYYARWVQRDSTARLNVRSASGGWRQVTYSDGKQSTVSTVSASYTPMFVPERLCLAGGQLQAIGAYSDLTNPRLGELHVGVNEALTGVTSAWVVATDDAGTKHAFALGSDWVWLSAYSGTTIVYLNGCTTYKVTWNANGGAVSPASTSGVLPYATVTAPVPADRAGYAFAGWYDSAGAFVCAGGASTPPVSGNVTYTARWVAVGARVITYSDTGSVFRQVAYDDGSVSVVGEYSTPYTAALVADAIRLVNGQVQQTGYSASGDVMRSGTLTVGTTQALAGVRQAWLVVNDPATGNRGMLLGSGWTSLAGFSGLRLYLNEWPAYDITWDAAGGSVSPGSTTGLAPYEAVTSPEPTWKGRYFLGWYDTAGKRVCGAGETVRVGASARYVAHWSAYAYTVELDANGERATVSPESLECAYDEDVALPTPERYGYAFLGWDTERDGTGTRYQAGVVRNLAEEDGATVALYAQWALITNVELPITAAASVGFELGVPDGSIRVAGTEDEPVERAEGWVRSKMPIEVRLDSISCEPAGDAASAGTDAERFWADNAGYADVSVQPAGSAASAMVLSAGDSVSEAAIPSWFTIPAATSAADLGELRLLYGLSLDRLFADPADGGAGVDIASLLPEGDGESFGIPTGLLRLVLTVDVSKYAS